jgi:hypothetical protein
MVRDGAVVPGCPRKPLIRQSLRVHEGWQGPEKSPVQRRSVVILASSRGPWHAVAVFASAGARPTIAAVQSARMGNRSRRFKASGLAAASPRRLRHASPLAECAAMTRKTWNPGIDGAPDGKLVQPPLQGML